MKVAHLKTKLAAVLLLAGLLGASAVAQNQPKPEQVAQQSSDAFLVLVDAGKYADSWDVTAQAFKSTVTKEQWQGMLTASLGPLGKVTSRKLKSATYTKTLPGAPDGEYVVIQYDSSFEHRPTAVETVVPMLDKDGKWRVSGYFIK